MKELILLVGPQGSGKTTYCKNQLSQYFRISQDDMGKTQHFTYFEKALKNEDLIVIDRINNIRSQRYSYLSKAKEFGFKTKIIHFKVSYEECFERIINRKNHPTLPSTDESKIRLALAMFFNKFRYIKEDEADEIVEIGEYEPYILDITKECKNKRVIVVGDLHGCYDELLLLLRKLKYDKNKDIIIFTGDIVDRGPKIRECLQFVYKNTNVYTVMGNHDYKLVRYLRGNPVKIKSIEKTLEQCQDLIKDKEFKKWLGSLPLCIKWKKNKYVVHAGINPNNDMGNQRREYLLYARRLSEEGKIGEIKNKYWFEFPYEHGTIYFGHDVHDKMKVAHHAYSLDGGCIFGGELRAFVNNKKLVKVKALEKYIGVKESILLDIEEPTYYYDKEVSKGNLRKAEKENLVLYNYTEQCVYEKDWNKYTREARGLILDKETGEVICRPLSKFFNLGEMPETLVANLPKGKYKVFDKLDGSNVNLYWHRDKPCLATRGSFESIQAKEAQKILDEKYNVNDLDRSLTLIFEVIYPENRLSTGARLVVDYGDTRDLFLLAVKNRHTGEELSTRELEKIANKYGFPVSKRYNHTIIEMLELQKTLPETREGWVVRFSNGLRVKVKGEEYCKRHKLLNSITPLNIWNVLEKGKVPKTYMQEIPEEFREEVEEIERKLNEKYNVILDEIKKERKLIPKLEGEMSTPQNRKTIGLWLREAAKDGGLKHPSAIFPYIMKKDKFFEKYIKERIRPTGNLL